MSAPIKFTLKPVDRKLINTNTLYDPIIDAFLEQEHECCQIEIEVNNINKITEALRTRIETRNLRQKILLQKRGPILYLTKLNTNK